MSSRDDHLYEVLVTVTMRHLMRATNPRSAEIAVGSGHYDGNNGYAHRIGEPGMVSRKFDVKEIGPHPLGVGP